MGISGIGGLAPVGVGTPYLYNTNRITANSLIPIQPIGADVVRAPKTDYSSLAGLSGMQAENENPLKPGQTKNLADILGMQMQMGMMNASRVMDVSPFESE